MTSFRSIRFLVPALALLAQTGARADATPVENLLSFYASSCPSHGAWSQAALGKATALRTALSDLANDPDCQGLSAETTTASAIVASLTTLNQKTAFETAETTLIAQEQAVLTSMAGATDPVYLASLQTVLTQIDAQVVATRATDRMDLRASAASQLITATHSIVNQALANQKCVLKRPGLLAGLGAMVANVGGALTAVHPAIGLGVSEVGTLMSDMVNLFRQRKLTKAIKKVNRAALQPEAISCVLESLSSDYCRARDAMTAMDWSQRHRVRQDYPVTSPLYGLGLLDREVDNFSKWLGTVKVAALAQTPADASRAADFRNREALYLSSPDIFSGVVATYRSQLAGVNDVKLRWPIVRAMIGELTMRMASSESAMNPLFQKKTRNESEFFLIGLDANLLPKVNGNVPTFDSGWDPSLSGPQTVKLELADIQAQFDAWFADTKTYVDDLRAQILQPDVLGTLEAAYAKEQDYSRGAHASENKTQANYVSPYQSLRLIREYFEAQLRQNGGQPETFYYLPDTIARLARIQSDLEALHLPKKVFSAKDYGALLADIYTQANLQQGNSFLRNRFVDHINNALIRFLTDPANAAENAPILAQTLASERMTDILTKTNPKGDLGLVREDIGNSITIVLPTLTTFVETFAKEIADVLNFLHGQEVLYGKGATGATFRDKRAKICLLLTNLAKWPKDVPYGLCEGTSFSTLEDGPRSPVLTADFMSKPVDDRACGYDDLQRDTLIYQTKLDFKSLR